MTTIELGACPPHLLGGVVVRPVDARDLVAVEAMWSRCSAMTQARRFLGGRGHASWLVGGGRAPRLDLGAWCGPDLVGIGSLVSDSVDVWEAAMVVEDARQWRGVGGLLAAGLVRAATAYGVHALIVSTAADSVAVPALLRRYAGSCRPAWQGSGVVEYRVELGTP